MPETSTAPGLSPLRIDLLEPDAPTHVGDRVPCHLFMPEVAWPAPLGPVIRTGLRCELPPRAGEPRVDLMGPPNFVRVVAAVVGVWVGGAGAIAGLQILGLV
jgi:hypothetical protein